VARYLVEIVGIWDEAPHRGANGLVALVRLRSFAIAGTRRSARARLGRDRDVACYKMGWARLLFAGALFPPGSGAEENRVPQRLVVEGPYRHARIPLYVTDFALILSAALLCGSWALVLLAALYLLQLAFQFPSKRMSCASVSESRTVGTAASCRVSSPASSPLGARRSTSHYTQAVSVITLKRGCILRALQN
jgi:hypothetical protein